MKAAEVVCSLCGKVAAWFAALDAGEGTGFLASKARIERTAWFGTCERPASTASGEALVARIAAGEIAALAREDPDLVAFFCRRCGRSYCQSCWRVGPPVMDDGFYDCTEGTCPQGHTQTLDD